MSLPRFFLEDQVIAAEAASVFVLSLAPEDAKHARVLRLTPGEHLMVIDGAQDCFECKIEDFAGDLPLVSIARHEDAPDESPWVMLLQGLAKGDKMDAVIRQGTELGVSAFVPLACERSVVRLDAKRAAKRVDRWRSIAKSAAMQSAQPRIPDVRDPMTVADACTLLAGAAAVIVCWEEAPATATIHDAMQRSLALAKRSSQSRPVAVVVGPEGGLAQAEVDALLGCSSQAHLASLGSSILRTETAGIIAPALVLYELGSLGGVACP